MTIGVSHVRNVRKKVRTPVRLADRALLLAVVAQDRRPHGNTGGQTFAIRGHPRRAMKGTLDARG